MESTRTRRAIERLLCAVGDPQDLLQDIRAGDDDYAQGQCIRIGVAVLSKLPSSLPHLEAAIRSLADRRLQPSQRLHVQAGTHWLQGEPVRAMQAYAGIVAQDPGDLLALRLALSCGYFIGDHAGAREIADGTLRQSRRPDPGHGYRLALTAFEHAELGDADHAESLARAALDLNPACPMAVHSMTHALIASSRSHRGAQWMREQRAQWTVRSRMRTHNAWHLAMFDLDMGRPESAVSILDGCLLPASDSSPIDACDAVALSWRLARAGIDVGHRWSRLSGAFGQRWQAGYWPYVDLHAAVAHGEAREPQRLQALESAIAACAAGNSFAGQRARRITLPTLGALDAWLAGDREGAVSRLAAIPGRLLEAGGSRAQLGAFAGPTR